MPLFPFMPIVALIVLGYVLYLSWLDPDQGRRSLIATFAAMGLSLAYYYVFLRRRGRTWILRDPHDLG